MAFTRSFGRGALVALVAGVAFAMFGGCSSTGGTGGDAGTVGTGENIGPGICQTACDKSCNVDNDCNTQNGELCCNYGAAGKVCQSAASCPIFCASDTSCQTGMGQACVERSARRGRAGRVRAGRLRAEALRRRHRLHRQHDQVLHHHYDRPICTAAAECPTACSADSQCNTADGEICCTTVKAAEPDLSASGLCLNPAYATCPKTCTTSSDCTGSSTKTACREGILPVDVRQELQQQRRLHGPDLLQVAQGVLAAGADALRGDAGLHRHRPSPAAPPATPRRAPVAVRLPLSTGAGTCEGSPYHSTCASCGTECGTTYRPSCTLATGGSCTGTPYYSTCASCGSECGTEYCPGCVSAGSCTGTQYTCAQLAAYGQTHGRRPHLERGLEHLHWHGVQACSTSAPRRRPATITSPAPDHGACSGDDAVRR